MKEISKSTLQYDMANIDNIKFDERQAEIAFKFLMSMGATKDIKMWLADDGSVKISKPFKYQSTTIPLEPEVLPDGTIIPGDDGQREGVQYYEFGKFLKTLIRFDRAAWKRMKNVEQKINKMNAGIDALKRQL